MAEAPPRPRAGLRSSHPYTLVVPVCKLQNVVTLPSYPRLKVLDSEKPVPQICRRCCNVLVKFHAFKMQCIEVNQKLQKIRAEEVEENTAPKRRLKKLSVSSVPVKPASNTQVDFLDAIQRIATKRSAQSQRKLQREGDGSSCNSPKKSPSRDSQESSTVNLQSKHLSPSRLSNLSCLKTVKVEGDDMETSQLDPLEFASSILNYDTPELDELKLEPSCIISDGEKANYGENNDTHIDTVGTGQGLFIKSEKSLSLDIQYDDGRTEKLCNNCGKIIAFPYQNNCPVCNMGFLEEKKPPVKNIKPFKCHICSEEFGSKSTFSLHLKYHAQMNKFRCGVCESKFSSGKDLQNHYRMQHNDDTDLTCSLCKLPKTRHKSLTALLTHMFEMHDMDASITSCSDEDLLIDDYGFDADILSYSSNQDESCDKKYNTELAGISIKKRGRPLGSSLKKRGRPRGSSLKKLGRPMGSSLKKRGRPLGSNIKKRGRPPKCVKTGDMNASISSSSDEDDCDVDTHQDKALSGSTSLKKRGRPPGSSIKNSGLTPGLKKRGRPPKCVEKHDVDASIVSSSDKDDSDDSDVDMSYSPNQDESCDNDEPLIGSSLKKPSRLSKHVKPIIIKEASLCSYCGKTFPKLQHLKQHIRSAHLNIKNYQCDRCDKRYSVGSALRIHIEAVHENRKFQCALCGSLLSSSSGLSSHLRKHANRNKEPTIKCPVCPKLFKQKKNVDRHMRSHTGETPYKCPFCPRQFTIRWNLTQHERLHLGEKPFKCSKCEKAFTYNCSLKNHMKYHKDEVEMGTEEEEEPCV